MNDCLRYIPRANARKLQRMAPGIHYVRTDDGVRIAFAQIGGGAGTPLVAMRPPQFSHLEREWKMPVSHHEYAQFADDRSVIRFDARSTGMSDREVADQSLEARLLDLEAVLSATGAERIVLDSISSSALTAIAFAARHPERVERLIVQNAFADGRTWWNEPNRRALLALAAIEWRVCSETWAWLVWGSADSESNLQLAEHIRACITANDFIRSVEAEREVDLRPILPRLTVPVLVLNHTRFSRMVPGGVAVDLASSIPAAQLVVIANTSDRVRVILDFINAQPVPAELVPAGPARRRRRRLHSLSRRELEVLRLLAEGLTNREVADGLVVGVRTVDSHVASIYRKTNTTTRAGAVAFAIRNGLL